MKVSRTTQFHPDVSVFAGHRPLPPKADRQKFIEGARLILAAARVITEQSDRCFTLPSTELPAENAFVAASSSF
jgi:hypothetical protein